MSFQSEHWQRIDPALDVLLQASVSERPALLDELTVGDGELRRELASLLHAHDAAGDFLEHPVPHLAASMLAAVEDGSLLEQHEPLIGRYRILEPIGRGGMGTVWLAERADGQYDKRVALKVVKRGMDTDEILARFVRERQILARLEHPNIARLLDGGVTNDGLPYLVMEYVAGATLVDYCNERRLSVDERLKLFETVCQAIHYAHKSLVVHRDLKPSNVFVTGEGNVKLLDFGIAKLLGDDTELVTLTGWSRPLTPEYASPEQMTGAPITTATDVYQLGVLLYELLTGRRPFRFDHHDVVAARHVICEVEPERPSVAVRRLRGDLDAIVLRALNKEPARRYPSADALSEDVRRHRAGLPVTARGVGSWYRIRKFVRRNRVRVATAAMFAVIALGFGTAYTLRVKEERDRAVLEYEKAGQTAEFFRQFFEHWNPDVTDRGTVTAENLLEEATRRTEREFTAEPEVQGAMLSLLGGLYTGIGRHDRADSLLNRALDLQRRLPSSTNTDLPATLARRARLLVARGRSNEAEVAFRQALQMNRAHFGARNIESLRIQYELAILLGDADRFSEAEASLREILALYDNRSGGPSLFLAEVTSSLGYAMFQQGNYGEARRILEPALAEQRRVFGDAHIVTIATMRYLASTLRDTGDLVGAEPLYREALRGTRALFGADHPQTNLAQFGLVLHLHRKGAYEEAERMARAGLRNAAVMLGEHHPRTMYWAELLAEVRLDRGDQVEAERLLRSALADLYRAFPQGHQDETDMLNRLAYIATGRKAPDAGELYRKAIAVRRVRPAGTPDYVTDGIHFLAATMVRMGDLDDAESVYRDALVLYSRTLPPGHPYLAFVRAGLHQVEMIRAARR